MKPTAAVVVGMLLVCLLASCGTRRGYRADDPYLYRRGKWNFAKGGIFDDIPQFSLQMLESMFDYGVQPVDPPSEYETATVLDTADAGGRYLSADAAISSGTRAIDAAAFHAPVGSVVCRARGKRRRGRRHRRRGVRGRRRRDFLRDPRDRRRRPPRRGRRHRRRGGRRGGARGGVRGPARDDLALGKGFSRGGSLCVAAAFHAPVGSVVCRARGKRDERQESFSTAPPGGAHTASPPCLPLRILLRAPHPALRGGG